MTCSWGSNNLTISVGEITTISHSTYGDCGYRCFGSGALYAQPWQNRAQRNTSGGRGSNLNEWFRLRNRNYVIAVVRDQSAAKVVASQFDFIRVNLVDRGDDGFAVSLEHSLGWSDSGGCKLRVDRWAEALNVASNLVQGDAMSAQRGWRQRDDWRRWS